MGRLLFPNQLRLDLDDRSLAHLQVVMLAKMRRGESFHLSWADDPSIGDGRTTVWVHPETSLVLKLTKSVDSINPAWIEKLTVAANSVAGLTLLAEPDHSPRAGA